MFFVDDLVGESVKLIEGRREKEDVTDRFALVESVVLIISAVGECVNVRVRVKPAVFVSRAAVREKD